jgi:hypothetical protein
MTSREREDLDDHHEQSQKVHLDFRSLHFMQSDWDANTAAPSTVEYSRRWQVAHKATLRRGATSFVPKGGWPSVYIQDEGKD